MRMLTPARPPSLATVPSFVLIAAAFVAACGPAEQPPAVPTSAPTASAAPTVTAIATTAPAASSAEIVTPPKPEKRVLQFWSWDGPTDGPAITGKRAWTAIAEGKADDRYRRVFISVEPFTKVDGKNNVFTAPYGEVVSPVALAANLTPPASLKKGDAVFADNSNDSAFGRVTKIEGETVTMSYVFGQLAGEHEAPKAEVVLLDGTPKLGAPVAYRVDGKWHVGRLLLKGAEEAWVAPHWVDNSPFVKVKGADVRVIDVSKLLKVGDACIALGPNGNELVPGKVVKVLDDGVFYDVAIPGGKTVKTAFHQISAPLK
jgi:hypothetical protein